MENTDDTRSLDEQRRAGAAHVQTLADALNNTLAALVAIDKTLVTVSVNEDHGHVRSVKPNGAMDVVPIPRVTVSVCERLL
ncbi:MAG: hypothetical protein HC889_00520 [Synechococcaceae cyanobacterium SM1_2_3]|nr:hypothetical protein [Synechococcaceae cyanobacterium SM1_2_3]